MPGTRRDTPDEATVRAALTVQFDACHACQACVAYCDAFPLMFDLIHGRADATPARSAGDLTVAEQDRIADACVRCGRCVADCRFGFDVPALADQALRMRRATGQLSLRQRWATWWEGWWKARRRGPRD
jgi:Fe-S oxidoreductase